MHMIWYYFHGIHGINLWPCQWCCYFKTINVMDPTSQVPSLTVGLTRTLIAQFLRGHFFLTISIIFSSPQWFKKWVSCCPVNRNINHDCSDNVRGRIFIIYKFSSAESILSWKFSKVSLWKKFQVKVFSIMNFTIWREFGIKEHVTMWSSLLKIQWDEY